MSDDQEPGVSPSNSEVPDDKGSDAIEEYGSRTDDNEPAASLSEAQRRPASQGPDAIRIPNFLPADTKDEATRHERNH